MQQTATRKLKKSKLTALLRFDAQLRAQSPEMSYWIGLDEVGRGSLISSVVGGAVCLPPSLTRSQKKLLTWLDDSKKLTPSLRAELSAAIQDFCAVGIGEADKAEIDQLNIHYASLLAIYRAFQQLCIQQGRSSEDADAFLLLDGRALIPDFCATRQKAIVKGDGLSASIAAASIVAKHYRDSKIQQLAQQYPGYGWEVNMGYPTPAHLKGIQTLGITPLHRKNFRKVHEQLTFPIPELLST